MLITVRYLSIIREITNTREEVIEVGEGTTVQAILGMLSKKYGKIFQRMIRSGRDVRGLKIVYFVNGKNIDMLQGLETPMWNNSELVLIPPVAGGKHD